MAMSRATIREKVESYANSLLDSIPVEEWSPLDLSQLRHELRFNPEVLGLLDRMENAGDKGMKLDILKDLKELMNADENVVTVTVTTAVPMNLQLRNAVKQKCKEDFDAPVFLVEQVDPKIMGGIILEARGQRRDASVRTQLANIRRDLSNVATGGAIDA